MALGPGNVRTGALPQLGYEGALPYWRAVVPPACWVCLPLFGHLSLFGHLAIFGRRAVFAATLPLTATLLRTAHLFWGAVRAPVLNSSRQVRVPLRQEVH